MNPTALAPAKSRYFLALAALLVASTTALTGCYSGFRATTNVESTMNAGNGTGAQIGPIRIENATLVLGPAGSTAATLLTTIVNQGPADTLIFAEINKTPVYVTPGSEEIPAGAAISYGYNSESWINAYKPAATVSTFVPVTLQFKNAGIVKFTVLVVPPVGFYEGVAPNPATLPAQ